MKVLLYLCLSCIPTLLFAQEGYEHLSPIAHAAGRTYVVTSRNLAAVGLNPALLGLNDDNTTIEIQVFPISSFGLDAGPSFSDVNALSGVFNTGIAHFTDSSLSSIANLLSNGKLSGRGDAEILGILYRLPSIGTFALTWTTHGGVRTDIPQSFLDFAQFAEAKILTENNAIDNFDLQAMWYSEYSLSFGKTLEIGLDSSTFLKNISVGGAIKLVSGIAYLKVDDGNYIHTSLGRIGGEINMAVNFDEHSAYSSNFDPQHVPNRFSFDFLTTNSAGSGLGADIGVCLGLWSNKHGTPTVTLGLSATDIGSITWNENATERIADHLTDTINYQGTVKDVTDSLKKFGGILKHISSFTTPLPTMFRAGVQIDLDAMGIEWGMFVPKIAVEYANGLTNLVGSLKNGRLGAGLTLEEKGNIDLRLNGGFVIEPNASDITLGIGVTLFKFLNIDLATARALQLIQSGTRTDFALAVRAAF